MTKDTPRVSAGRDRKPNFLSRFFGRSAGRDGPGFVRRNIGTMGKLALGAATVDMVTNKGEYTTPILGAIGGFLSELFNKMGMPQLASIANDFGVAAKGVATVATEAVMDRIMPAAGGMFSIFKAIGQSP